MRLPRRMTLLLTSALAALGAACNRGAQASSSVPLVRILFLHHSTGESIWEGGVAPFFKAYNRAHGTNYQITERWYPDESMGNYPYDYWNLWVNPAGPANAAKPGFHGLDTLTAQYDVIVFKHCFPASSVRADAECDPPSISSNVRTAANYHLQYEALKARLRQFPKTRFILWTGASLTQASTTPDRAQRAQAFFDWVRHTWDEKGDNIYLWDFQALETEGGLYMKDAFAYKADDSHPGRAFARSVAPLLGQRIVDVAEGRGDTGSLTGK